jgi:hypothetical protein
LDPGLELSDALAEAGRLAMNRILQPLDELLQMADPGLEHLELILTRTARSRLRGLSRPSGTAANLPDPSQ